MAEKYYSLTELVKLTDNLIAALPTSFYSGIMAVRGGIASLPYAEATKAEDGEWSMFNLLSSAYWGKQYYFRQDNGIVYSRESGKYMSFDDAVSEFIKRIGDDGEY